MSKSDEVPNNVVYSCITGSKLYGLATPTSDTDVRGVFFLNDFDFVTNGLLSDQIKQVDVGTNDVVYYEMKRFIELLAACNPNIIELLYVPDQYVLSTSSIMDEVLAVRDLFVTKKAEDSFCGYAESQIKRASSQNRWVNNPQPHDRPIRASMCYLYSNVMSNGIITPWRPVPLNETGVDISQYNAAAVEHMPNCYRLYYYGDEAKGVFRDDGPPVCSSIPMDDEESKFRYIMLFDEVRYKKACEDWKNYWDWRNSRNDKRWFDVDGEERKYDAKNMSHCIRLLYSCLNIARTGSPLVRLEGEMQKQVMDIKMGKPTYKLVSDLSNSLLADVKREFPKRDLPDNVDVASIKKLYYRIHLKARERCTK
jgi:predicted nucleotidyltransferase